MVGFLETSIEIESSSTLQKDFRLLSTGLYYKWIFDSNCVFGFELYDWLCLKLWDQFGGGELASLMEIGTSGSIFFIPRRIGPFIVQILVI